MPRTQSQPRLVLKPKTKWVLKENTQVQEDKQLVEDYYYEALAIVNLRNQFELDEESMRPEIANEKPKNAGVDPETMKMKRWYQDTRRVSDRSEERPREKQRDDDLTGVDRASYQTRPRIEGDEERLAQRRGNLPPPPPGRVANPRIREDRALQEWKTEEMHGASYDNEEARAWFDYCRRTFPQSIRKVGPDAHLHSTSSYQCSILFNNMGSFNRRSEFRRSENVGKPLEEKEKFHHIVDP